MYTSLLKISFFFHHYFLGSLKKSTPVSSILQYQTLSLHLYLFQNEVSPLIKEERGKGMDIQGQTPVKSSSSPIFISQLMNSG